MERMLYRVSEVAGFLGISRGKAYQLIGSGELRSVKIGGCRRVRVEDLRAYLDSLAPEVDECTA
ncbi:helix-turn-helix domain-containing protein [Intrasporangium calvum]|uniref:helix-turn-helix domain-containing protein n=1 Tax=Intrasporangium calvum TaxID=53358 RepID=UPI000DF6017E|nr:helix-turn-helix domain-containing protein [Intrasporangium calvum]AXG12138.1 DNA-binding protein [Intrasporangium calvum]